MECSLKIFSLAKDGLAGKRPFEDALRYDAESGVFVIADGVGLWEGIEYEGRYPKKSGSAKLARVFCDNFVRHHKNNPNSDLLAAFRAGNNAAARINIDRSKYNVFRKHKGLFAATAAMAIIKGRRLEWAHVCDAGVVIVSKNGELKMRKDDCRHSFPWPKDTKNYESSTWTLFVRTIVRNAIGPEGKSQGYGVVTGEPEVEQYIEKGICRLSPGDSVVLFSDGFTPFLELLSFRKLIAKSTSEKDFRIGAEKIIQEKTGKIQSKLRGEKIDWLASFEVVKKELGNILGKDARKIKWAKEKSIIVIKARQLE